MRKHFIGCILLAILITPINAIADVKEDLQNKLLKQYEHNIYQYVNDLAMLNEKIKSSSGESPEYLEGLENLYKNTQSRLETETHDKYAVAQQIGEKDTTKVLEFRKELVANESELGNINNLGYPISAKADIITTFGYGLNVEDLETMEKHSSVLFYLPDKCEVLSQFNGTVEESDKTSVTVRSTENIKIKYDCLTDVKVTKGDAVKQNQVIALSGENSVGWPVLEMEIKFKDAEIDPVLLYQ